MRHRFPMGVVVAAFSLFAVAPAPAQEGSSVVSDKGIGTSDGKFRLSAEIKANYRGSSDVAFVFAAPGVPIPLTLQTVAPHGGFEISNVALIGEATLTPDVSAKAEIHFIDLYNRNPTSSDDRIAVREAWIRFGRKFESLRRIPGTTLYVEIGKFPRFSKQVARRFEGYGLWGTAVGRLEEVGVEAGGSFGSNIYWRASMTNGNPLFFRDPNALAGDNGTPERVDFANPHPIYNSGYPIFYDAKASDLSFNGKFLYGGGVGFRQNWGENGRDGVDVVGWYFQRTLSQAAKIRGTFYRGDLEILNGVTGGLSLPISGDEKWEAGANLDVRLGGFQLYGQYVYQEIAGLVRKGFEAEAAFRFPLNGLFVSGDAPVVNWIQPVVRYSRIENGFALKGYVVPSATWDWYKTDVGFRLGILRGVDLTAEFARNDVVTVRGTIHPDEFLSTLRVAF